LFLALSVYFYFSGENDPFSELSKQTMEGAYVTGEARDFEFGFAKLV